MYAMALPKNPTNFDLLFEIREVKNIAHETRKLAKKTNGRVDALESKVDDFEIWKRETEAIARDRISRRRSPQDLIKQALVVLGVALTIIATLVNFVVGK